MVVVVAKSKPKIPRITFAAPSQFSLDEGRWIEIEQAFGCCLDGQTRQEILVVTKQFLQFDEAQTSTGRMEDAVKRTRRLCEDATALLATLADTSCRYKTITRDYVDETIAASGGQDNLINFTAQISWFVKACIAALDQMEDMTAHRFWPDGLAWQIWIKQLTRIAKEHHLPTAARKDTDKKKPGQVSPFVAFVWKLQAYIPAAHRRATQSIDALSGAISTARSRTKSPV